MTVPDLSQIMPYGVTCVPGITGTDRLGIVTSNTDKVVGNTGLRVPKGVFSLFAASNMSARLLINILYSDGTPFFRENIIEEGGGKHTRVMSGENISYIQILATSQAADAAAGKRATVQIIPVPDPM